MYGEGERDRRDVVLGKGDIGEETCSKDVTIDIHLVARRLS